ncbi:MAG: D-alanyl-D-alanine carboxypeptidase family protein [Kiloniellaceae bacterium]
MAAAALWLSIAAPGLCPVAAAQPARPQPAYLVVDAESGTVLAQQNATRHWYPASVTKVMTAYMAFQALAEGRLTLGQRIPVSARAAAQPPTRLGLRRGSQATVKLLLEALIVRSANDAAVALAEAVSGSEADFVTAMTRQAQTLGMNQSVFSNASGLPDQAQVTTARDLVILARALVKDFPQYYAYFRKEYVAFGQDSRPTYNGWLGAYPGAEGFKTGFTCGSGYNLLAAAARDGRRLIAVVLGAANSGARNALMSKLMDEGFAAPPAESSLTIADLPRRVTGAAPYVLALGRCPVQQSPNTETMAAGELPGWGLVFGSFVSKAEASARIEENQTALEEVISQGKPTIVARTSLATHRYSALLVDLDREGAGSACRHLQSLGVYCLAVPPKLLNNPQAMWR